MDSNHNGNLVFALLPKFVFQQRCSESGFFLMIKSFEDYILLNIGAHRFYLLAVKFMIFVGIPGKFSGDHYSSHGKY